MIAFMKGKRKNCIVRDPVSTEGMVKLLPSTLKVPLGQGKSVVEGRCNVASAKYLYSKSQIANDELNHVNAQGSFCSGFCLQLHPLR